jgi:HAD superfamily hydrolase (TIGR01549 family)
VIWDYDGTLVDTRQKNLNVTRDIIREVLKKDYEDFPVLVNLENYEKAHARRVNWRDLYACEFQMNDLQTDYAGSLWTKYQLLNTSSVDFYNGLPEIIASLGNRFRQGIVSLNSLAIITNTLTLNGVHNYFSAIVGYEEVDFSKQKPDPDGLLKCLSHLDLIDKKCKIVYIGDHETDAHCVCNTNKILGEKKVISVAALYEKDCGTHDWKYQPDYFAFNVTDIPEIIAAIN